MITSPLIAASAALTLGASMSTNPLLAPWTGPHGGVPAFDHVKVDDFKPALEASMAEHLKEIDAIAERQGAPATFDNTIVALEKSGQALTRALTYFSTWSSSMSSPEFQKVEATMSPVLAAHQDKIVQNTKLFARIKAVYDSPAKAKLTPEQQRLCWYYFNSFDRQGANLDAAQKATMSQYNQDLAKLTTQFSQNQLGDEEKDALIIEKKDDLGGLSAEQISNAASEADRRGMKGKWVIANSRSAMEPFLTYASNRALREKGFKMWTSRGDMGNARDNNKLVTQILVLRAKKAKLLGYPTYAHWKMGDTMAKSPETALNLMMSVWKPAVEQFRKDVVEAQAIADAEGAKLKIAPWDYRYYAEKLRKKKYDLDFNEVKPYLQLEHMREAMFWAANELYGFTFTKVEGMPTFNANMSVYEVKRGNDFVGLWYFDPYARPGKQSGAWMNAYRDQQRMLGTIPTIVSNNARTSTRAKAGEPVLLSLGRCAHHVPRVRPRAARPQLVGDVPLALGHEHDARLRRVPLAVQRELPDDAAGAEVPREREGRADSQGAARAHREGSHVQRGLPDGRGAGVGHRRHEAAPRG